MRKLKQLYYSIIIFALSTSSAISGVTQATPSNIIKSIAKSTSFTSTAQNTSQAFSNIQNTTNTVISSAELKKAVEDDAKAFGLSINEAAMAALQGEDYTGKEKDEILVSLNQSAEVVVLEYPEPNLDTLVYDTGLMTLAPDSGAQYASDSTNIFDSTAGAQKARIVVYVDFKRKKQWGDVESHITLNGQTTIINNVKGAKSDIDELPIDRQLTHTISSITKAPLRIDNSIDPTVANNEEPYNFTKHSINSLLKDNATPTLADYDVPSTDIADRIKSISHSDTSVNGMTGDKGVMVGAKFITASSTTPGTSTASFEASHADICGNSCSSSEQNVLKTKIVRYSATASTTPKKYTGD